MAVVAWGLTLYCDFVVCYLAAANHWSSATVGVYNALVVLGLWAHARTMGSDPGAVPADALSLDDGAEPEETICGRCDAFKPLNSHHCRVCGRCIVRMDHHWCAPRGNGVSAARLMCRAFSCGTFVFFFYS